MKSVTSNTKKVNIPIDGLSCGVAGLTSDYRASYGLVRAERTPGAVAVSLEAEGAGLGFDRLNSAPPLLCKPHQEEKEANTSLPLAKINTYWHDDQSGRGTCADTSWAVVAKCQNEPGKYFAKRIPCGKEWCAVCGQKRSKVHNRRIARVLPKAQQIDKMGYFVIEFPDRFRKVLGYCYSIIALRHAGNRIIEVFAGKRGRGGGRKGGFFSRGLMRWHWFGDKKQGKWNPHVNILVDSAYIDDLEPIKKALRTALKCPDLIIHYSFKELPAQKFQCVEYITRPTFLNYNWDQYMAAELYGFRNQRWWGSWEDAPVWSADANQEAELLEADALEDGLCPDCGGDLVWSKPINAAYLTLWQAEEIGETGFYRLPNKVFDGDVLGPGDIMRLDRLKELHIANVIAMTRDKAIPWNDILVEADGYDEVE